MMILVRPSLLILILQVYWVCQVLLIFIYYDESGCCCSLSNDKLLIASQKQHSMFAAQLFMFKRFTMKLGPWHPSNPLHLEALVASTPSRADQTVKTRLHHVAREKVENQGVTRYWAQLHHFRYLKLCWHKLIFDLLTEFAKAKRI